MEFEDFKLDQIRSAARKFVPETRGDNGIAKRGSKEELIELLRNKGVMACEVSEYFAGNAKVEPPEDNPVIPVIPSDNAGQGTDGTEAGKDNSGAENSDGGQSKQEQPEQPEDKPQDELEILRNIITKNVKQQQGVDVEAVSRIVDEKFEEFRKKIRKDTVKVIEVKQPDNLPNKVIGVCHKLTQQIAQVCSLGVHQMLVGPAGGGKTTCCEKVAEILNLNFYPLSVGPQTTKSDLLGFIDAAGNYHTTPLRDAFEKGGLLLLDEVDAANAGVLTIMNSLLANGYCSFPDGVKKRHEDFRCICACNTYGRGADRQYVGRNQLDAATLDSFAVVDFDYDEDMERAIAGDNTWVEKIQRYRKRAFDLKMRVVISPRASIFGARLLAAGMKENLVEELVVWKGVAKDIRQKIMAF